METDSDEPEVDADEFWMELKEDEPVVQESPFKTEEEYFRSTSLNRAHQKKFNFRSLTFNQDLEFRLEMNKTIEEIRAENSKQEEEIKKQVRMRTKKELKEAVEEINRSFEKEIHMIRLEYEKMKKEISKKNREIYLLGKFMIDQETLIAQNRLVLLVSAAEELPSAADIAEKKQLRSDLNVLKIQIEGMKEAIVEYTNETNAAAAKIRDLDQEIDSIKNKHKEEYKELETLLNKKVEKAIEERDKVRLEFEKFKSLGWKDIESKEDSLGKYKDIIVDLQEELKKAKEILHHPKLKLRVHNRLRDYVEEYEQDDDETVGNSVSKSVNTTNRSKTLDKKQVYSRRANKEYDTTNFTSTYSEKYPNYTKLYSRRSTVPDGYKTRLSPI